MNRSRAGRGRAPLVVLAVLFISATVLAPVQAGAPPILPVQAGRGFLPSLYLPPTSSGSSEPFGFSLANPLSSPVFNASFTLGFYAFNPYPGTGRQALPSPGPSLVEGGASVPVLTLQVGRLAAHASGWTTAITVSVPAGLPDGAYSLRDSLRFDLNGSQYVLESIGNFAPEQWRNATVLPNGTPTLNLTRLGVSGILPETALVVRTTASLDWALYVTLGAGFAFLGAATYFALRRRGPSSSSGASSAPEESQAPSALGNKRSKEGD